MPDLCFYAPWIMKEPIPDPFRVMLEKAGKKRVSYDEADCSMRNIRKQGKVSRLHGPTLQALLTLIQIRKEKDSGAAGIQRGRDTIQKEIFEHLQKELMEIPFEEGHDLVQKKLCRKTEISDFLKLQTEKYEGQLKQVKKRLRLKLLPILKNQKERTEHKLFLGRRVDLRNIAAPSGAVFKKQQPGKNLDICVAVLVDNSFSMCGERMDHAILAALCLYDFCMESEIPVLVCGHHTDGYRHENLKDETVYLHCCADFETDEKDRFRIAGMQSYGSNRDGTALWYAGSRLLERPEKQKLLFVISDGAPNANQYGGTGAKRDLQKIRKKLLQQGVFFQAAAIGSDKEAIQEIYEESFLDITDLEQLPALLTKKLLRFIRR